jgi:hypothetical protein
MTGDQLCHVLPCPWRLAYVHGAARQVTARTKSIGRHRYQYMQYLPRYRAGKAIHAYPLAAKLLGLPARHNPERAGNSSSAPCSRCDDHQYCSPGGNALPAMPYRQSERERLLRLIRRSFKLPTAGIQRKDNRPYQSLVS